MDKRGWTDQLEHLIKLQVEYGSDDECGQLVRSTRFSTNASNEDDHAFPKHIRIYANDRRQKLSTSHRLSRWITPSFDEGLYNHFKPNYFIDKLYARANGFPLPERPLILNMNRRNTPSKAAQSRDDESEAEFSFYNNKGFADGNDIDDELANALTSKVSLSPPRSKYGYAANILQLVVGASGNPIDNLTVSISKRKSDDGNLTVRAIILMLPILSPRDVSKVRNKNDGVLQICCILHTYHQFYFGSMS